MKDVQALSGKVMEHTQNSAFRLGAPAELATKAFALKLTLDQMFKICKNMTQASITSADSLYQLCCEFEAGFPGRELPPQYWIQVLKFMTSNSVKHNDFDAFASALAPMSDVNGKLAHLSYDGCSYRTSM